MRALLVFAMFLGMTACTGCESVEPVAPTTAPAQVAPATTKFQIGDEVILTIPPDGQTFDAVVREVTEVHEFGTGNGDEVQLSQGYIVVVTRKVTTEQGVFEFQIGIEVPEFALTRKRAINEKVK